MLDSATIQVTAVDFNPFAGPEIALVAPTTEPQIEIWTSCQLGGADASRAYNESVSLRFAGALDRSALERAVDQLVRRHEALRSAFSGDGRQMLVFADLTIPVSFTDLVGRPEAEQGQVLADYVNADARHTFDLINGPLVRFGLFRLSATDHQLVLTAHHIVCDGWSLGILLQDLGTLYSAYVRHEVLRLPETPQISAYSRQQTDFVASPVYRETEQYWIDQYHDTVPILNLPTDFPRPPLRTFTSSRRDYALPTELAESVRRMGAKAGASFVATLLAAFDVLLHRLTGQDDIVVGLPAAGQSAADLPRLVGHCVHLLPLRSFPRSERPFIDFLHQRKEALLDAFEHQQLTFGSLLRKLNPPRDPSRVPMVPVIFNVDLGLDNDVHFEGLTYRFISNPRQFETVELFLNVGGSMTDMTLEWSYNTQLFRLDTIDRMMAELEQILRAVVADPTIPLGDIPLTNALALQNRLDAWNRTDADYPRTQPLHALLTQTARRTPEKIALIVNDRQLTYSELDHASSRVAHTLRAGGLTTGQVVGVMLDRTPELLIALLAVLKAGALYVPLDPDYPQDRIAFMLADSGAALLLTSAKYARGDLGMATPVQTIETVLSQSAGQPIDAPETGVGSRDLAYILYTSGSTGRPKGVQIEHRSLVNLLYSMLDWPGITAQDVLLGVTTVSFDIAGLELYLPLLVGATLVLADAETTRDGRALLTLLTDGSISIIQATPVTYRMLLAAGWQQKLPLKILCCGEPLPKDLAQLLLARCATLWNMYGPTETTIYSTGKQILPTDDVITIGRPIHNTQVYILDEHGNRLPEGIAGELYLAGDGVARGYLNRPELNTEKFVADPFSGQPDARMYRTGDLGMFTADGEINCLGRIDQQIKIRGYRVEPGEIEQALLPEPGVGEVLVMAREDRPGDQRLVAYVRVEPELTPALFTTRQGAWRARLRDILPAYMVPADFVRLTEWPITPNGKIDRKALPRPDARRSADALVADKPRTDIEKRIASIWAEALGHTDIGLNDDFFDLGGHSMIAVQVMTQLEKETGRRLPLSTLLTFPTIQKLASLFTSEEPVSRWKSLVPIRPEGTKDPIYIIHGIGLNLLNFSSLVAYMSPEQPIYGLQARGLDGTDEPFDSIEAIAEFYISEVLQQNPEGPYAIAGYSFGGYVALEMARQLQAMGKRVKLLAMFDTNAEESMKYWSRGQRLWRKLGKQLPKLWWISQSLVRQPAMTLRYQWNFVEGHWRNLQRSIGLYQEPPAPPELDHLHRIMEKHEIAFDNYRLRPYDGVIDLFKARIRVYFVDDNKYLGWKKFALKGVRVHEVPGDHKMMMLPPNDKVFAQVLQQALDNCDQN